MGDITMKSVEKNKNQSFTGTIYEYVDESNIDKYADYNYVVPEYNYDYYYTYDYSNFDSQSYDYYGNIKNSVETSIAHNTINDDTYDYENVIRSHDTTNDYDYTNLPQHSTEYEQILFQELGTGVEKLADTVTKI